ncbi:MAG: extracellular solute-binding protein [Actinobacteria bacterium]|nr:extracellular solute-binding protein [Actinomycetota bacterium]
MPGESTNVKSQAPAEPAGSALSSESIFGAITRRQAMARAGGALFAASALGGVLSACGSSASGSGSGGGSVGGELTMLVWEGYDSPKASAAFRKKNGVTVHAEIIGSNSEVITKLLAGGASSTAVVTPGNGLLPLLVEAEVLDPVDWSKLPNTKKYTEQFKKLGEKSFAINGQTYAAPFLWGINSLVYNAAYVQQAPASYMDLMKPEYTNKIGLLDDVGNIQTWATVLGHDALNMSPAELKKVTEFLIELKTKQARVFTGDFDALAQALAAGDIVAVASPLWTNVSQIAEQHGSKTVKWTVPSSGGILWTDTWALPKGGPNRETAYAWIDWMIGQPANAMVANELSEAPVNGQATKQVENTSSKALYAPDVQEKTELFGFPVGNNGTVSYQDWTSAWKEVEAA